MNVNKAIIVGRLTRDPEMRTTPSGQNVTNFTIATSTKWKSQDGQQQEKTEFHNVVAWGRRGEVINQYVTKGQELFVEGKLETRSWDDQETGKKMYRTEIILDNFEFGAKPGTTTGTPDPYDSPDTKSATSSKQSDNPTPVATQDSPEEEEIPTINLDDETDDVKIEDVPF
jgi:single-strand DNA-binding protein